MFLFRVVDLLALVGLFVQTFVAWVFVALVASIGRRERHPDGFHDFYGSFLALAAALTSVSIRFFRTHEVGADAEAWLDGRPWPVFFYVVYLAGKALFGLLLVRGCYRLAQQEIPRWLRRAWWPVVVAAAATPLVLPDIHDVLLLQAPCLVAAAGASLRGLRPLREGGSGLRLVRRALVGLMVTWSVHALAVLTRETVFVSRYVLGFNSMIDLGVQLALGTGLILCVIQEAHRQARAAEQERERLQRELDRDEKLRALGTMVSGVAHELNNPLTVILGYCDLLQDGLANGGDDQPARVIAEQAERCRGIVQNLSAVSVRAHQRLDALHARELVERVVRGIAPGLLGGERRIEVAPIPDVRFAADRVGLEQVLANLVINALQASPDRGVVRIEASASGERLEVAVRDDGPGVPVELRARLFEPFFTTKAAGRGTGLGLAIAHAIVRAHGGTIEVEDPPGGHGTVFRVSLPLVDPPPARREAPVPGASRRLLVIDDEPPVRTIVRRQAERRGWRVREAGSAEEALRDELGLLECDAVLCDLCMPGMGGAGLHDLLAARDSVALERTVFLTGDLASEESVRFARRCRRPIVTKPLDFDELFAAIEAGRGPRCAPVAEA